MVQVTPKEFATYLKKHRKDKKLSYVKVASKLGIKHANSVYHWETGFSFPAPKHFKAIAELYNIDYSTLKQLFIAVKVYQKIKDIECKFAECEG